MSIDKVTAVRTYKKVQRFWAARIESNQQALARGDLTSEETDLLEREISFMRKTDMAVVISSSQNEIADMAERGIDIKPHRKRMVEEKLEESSRTRRNRSGSRSCARCGQLGSMFRRCPPFTLTSRCATTR